MLDYTSLLLISFFIIQNFIINSVYSISSSSSGNAGNNNNCQLPVQWLGVWYQNKDVDLMHINQTSFLNRGTCIEHKEDKYMFFDGKESCYRCIFIMQKHFNVLQYRASYCTEQSDFNSNCDNLSPESELVTLYRDDALTENCPLNGLFTLLQSPNSLNINPNYVIPSTNQAADTTADSSNKCSTNSNQESIIMECADPTMLKLQFSKCINMPTFDISCMAHWTEGSTNYLIGRTILPNQRRGYKCLVYTESKTQYSSNSNKNSNSRNVRYKYDENGINGEDFIDLSQNLNSQQIQETIQISISQDEFCRNIDNIIDDQFSFTFSRVSMSKFFNPYLNQARRNRQHRQIRKLNNSKLDNSISLSSSAVNSGSLQLSSSSTHSSFSSSSSSSFSCRFPKWFNKKWNNVKQNKLFTLDFKLDTLIVFDDKNMVTLDKYNCIQTKSRKQNTFQALIRTLNGCSTTFQCVTIISRSDFVAEIRFSKVKHTNSAIECTDHFHQIELLYVDSSFGVTCPFKGNIFRKVDQIRASPYNQLNDGKEQTTQNEQPCKFMTQTQTLQIGCQNDQQYSLRTKLCYPNQPSKLYDTEQASANLIDKLSITQTATNTYTQLESEINLSCLAHWTHEENIIIISRSMSNEILCSMWSSSNEGKLIKLYEIDSNCNYHKKNYKLNHEFQLINKCDEKALTYTASSSMASTAITILTISKLLKLILINFLIQYINVFILR